MAHTFAPKEPVDLDEDDADDVDVIDDRRNTRVNVPFSVRVVVNEEHGSAKMTGHVVNLSEGGAALRVFGQLTRGAAVRLFVDVGRVPVVVPARVVWSRTVRHDPIVAVAFDELDASQHAAIAALTAEDRK